MLGRLEGKGTTLFIMSLMSVSGSAIAALAVGSYLSHQQTKFQRKHNLLEIQESKGLQLSA